MEFRQIIEQKADYMDLLLIADESETMIASYLTDGQMHTLVIDNETVGIAVVTMADTVVVLQNLAIVPTQPGQGYGGVMLNYLTTFYQGQATAIILGTGDSPKTVPFYEKHGFVITDRIANHFVEKYPQPIFEAGVQLIDQIWLRKQL